jgi:glycosyltransferase involved in cell wall biosynthesis
VSRVSISIFYPCYNDWGTIGSMVLLTLRTVKKLDLDAEVIIVDDGSRHHTQDALDELAARFPEVRIIRHEQNRGYGGALRTGFAEAAHEWVFYTDGDAQYDVRELERLVERIGPDVDVVQGYKIQRHDPLHRIIIGRAYHWLIRMLFGLRMRDVDCDFRLMRRNIFDAIELTSTSGTICAEMMTKVQRAGYRMVEVPVHHYERAHGKSQFFNFPRLVSVAWQLAGLWWREVVCVRFRGGASEERPA